MRDQYAGDISDALKFAFLRALTGADRKLGIAWYYVPVDDGRPDGRHIEWRNEPAWRLLDEQLHAGLSNLPERSVVALEKAAIWPKDIQFYREPVPSGTARAAWAERKLNALDGSDIVFLDPDNGIGENSDRHASIYEVAKARQKGRAIVFITFPGRKKHEILVKELHEKVAAQIGCTNMFTLRTGVSIRRGDTPYYLPPRARWFSVIDADAELVARAQQFATDISRIPRVTAELSW